MPFGESDERGHLGSDLNSSSAVSGERSKKVPRDRDAVSHEAEGAQISSECAATPKNLSNMIADRRFERPNGTAKMRDIELRWGIETAAKRGSREAGAKRNTARCAWLTQAIHRPAQPQGRRSPGDLARACGVRRRDRRCRSLRGRRSGKGRGRVRGRLYLERSGSVAVACDDQEPRADARPHGASVIRSTTSFSTSAVRKRSGR